MSVLLIFFPLLIVDALPLQAFFIQATAGECFGVAPIVLEDRSIVQVLERRDPRNNCLSVVLDLANAAVALQVEYFQVTHLHEDFLETGGVVDLVVLKVKGRDGGARKESL